MTLTIILYGVLFLFDNVEALEALYLADAVEVLELLKRQSV